MTMNYAAGWQVRFLGEQRSEPYGWYGKLISAAENGNWQPKVVSGKRRCRLARKDGA